jgi:hypothetical protein
LPKIDRLFWRNFSASERSPGAAHNFVRIDAEWSLDLDHVGAEVRKDWAAILGD